jgi:hypothetical protein
VNIYSVFVVGLRFGGASATGGCSEVECLIGEYLCFFLCVGVGGEVAP